MPYLADLSIRLAAGATVFSDEFRRRHASYLAEAANTDGGYSGRQGESDAYYTSFALRGLAMLGGLDPTITGRAAAFLQSRHTEKMSSIDFFSWVLSAELLRLVAGVDVLEGSDLQLNGQDRSATVAASIDRYRRPDGGYAKSPSNPSSSIYHTFLALACKELLVPPPDSKPEADGTLGAWELVNSRRRDDGGYVEITQMRQSGTNPTAAAVAILRMIGRLNDPAQDDARESAIGFLSSMQTGEGGFRANTQIPFADLLSTFTALTALDGMLAKHKKTLATSDGLLAEHKKTLADVVDLAAARRFAENLEIPQGGFRAGVWDDSPDVEYTFYGLGTLAMLNAEGFSDNG